MCNAKPGTRCASDMADRVTTAQQRLRDALVAHTQAIDDPAALEAVKAASQDLWVQQLEHASTQTTSPPANPGQDWWADAGAALQQAHKDQEALMPAKPPANSPKEVTDAYRHLAAMRDVLAQRDAIEAADHLAFINGTALPPSPLHGPRPTMWDADMRVAQAERIYLQALKPGSEYSAGENWRLLLGEGQMPYDPQEDASHPHPRDSAPWVKVDHTRPVTPGDLSTLRRATGQHEHIDWDPKTNRILIHPNPYGEAYDHAQHVRAYQHSLWQVGYVITVEDEHIVVHSVPDLPSWRQSMARPASAKVAS